MKVWPQLSGVLTMSGDWNLAMAIDVALPYRTDWRELIGVLDYCKGKGAERAALEARFGGGESLRETLNALEQFGLIERGESGDVRLTEAGDRLVYATDPAELRAALSEVLLAYRPYRVPLERALGDELQQLEGPWVERIWQVDMRLGQPRNRVEEARTLFFRLCDEAGLGTYRRGVRGQTTRLDISPDAFARLRQAFAKVAARSEPAPAMPEGAAPERAGRAAAVYPAGAPLPSWLAEGALPEDGLAIGAGAGRPAISIQVDMSDWELEKIEAFLRLIGYLPQRAS